MFVPGAERHLSSSLSLDRCHIQISSTRLTLTQQQQLCHCTLAQTLHPHLPAFPPTGDAFLLLPRCRYRTRVPLCAVMPNRLEQEDLHPGDVKKALTAELRVVSTCWAVNTFLPFRLEQVLDG